MEQLHFDPCFIGFFWARNFVLLPNARVEKMHFHPRGVEKMERLHFEATAGGPGSAEFPQREPQFLRA